MKATEFNQCVSCLRKYVLRNNALRDRQGGKFQRNREKALIRKLRSAWKKQLKYILAETAKLSVWSEEQTNAADNLAPTGDFDNILDGMPQKTVIADSIVRQMKSSMKKSGKDLVKKLDLGEFGISFDIEGVEATRFLGDKLKLELSNAKGNIDYTTKSRIKEILTKGANDGLTHAEVAKQIKAQADHGVFSIARSELIAQTEIGRAYGKGSNIPLEEFAQNFPERQTEKRWNTVGDGDVRTTHLDNQDDGWINFNQVHSGTSEMFAPSMDFNCRCVEEYRII